MNYKTFEYVWLDGYETQNLRSKIKIIHGNIDTSNIKAYWQFNNATSYFRIRNKGSGSAGAIIDSSVAKDQVFHKFTIEGKSSSLEYSIDDALEITRTSELPSVVLQPIIKGDNSGQNPLVGAIRYMECYNT